MLRKILGMLALGLAMVAPAWACACCADRGSYSISVRKPDSYLWEEMAKLAFTNQAKLFTTEAGLDPGVVRGLPADYNDDNRAFMEEFGFAGGFTPKRWKFDFKDYKNSTGSLLLTQPATMLRFAVDTHESDTGNVTLYKEWRFQGSATGTGLFQSGMAPNTKFFLVFQGRGNNCDSAADFTHWRVEITGPKAGYAFWGRLRQ